MNSATVAAIATTTVVGSDYFRYFSRGCYYLDSDSDSFASYDIDAAVS